MKIQISAVIITFNEEKNIARCLRSLQGIADETIVIDSFSTDKTTTIATELGARVLQRTFDGYASQKNYGNDLAQNDWILSLDADEELSPTLQQNILAIKANAQADAYKFNRAIFYLGQWIRHGNSYPDCRVRLWNKQKGRWGGGSVHETLLLKDGANIETLAGDLHHYSFGSVTDKAIQANKYTDLAALDLFLQAQTTSWAKLIFSPLANFFKGYILKGGFKHGKYSFGMATMFAYGVFLKYIKLQALEQRPPLSIILWFLPEHLANLTEILKHLYKQNIFIPEIIIVCTNEQQQITLSQKLLLFETPAYSTIQIIVYHNAWEKTIHSPYILYSDAGQKITLPTISLDFRKKLLNKKYTKTDNYIIGKKMELPNLSDSYNTFKHNLNL